MKFTQPAYNDGVALVYQAAPLRKTVGLNPSSIDGLTLIGKFAFARLSERQQDVELAEMLGFFLSLKIKIRRSRQVSSDMFIQIDSKLYETGKIDSDGVNDFLYLTEIVCDGTLSLVTSVETLNSIGVPERTETLIPVYCRKKSLEKRRAVNAAIDEITPTTVFIIRSCDYADQLTLVKDSKRYSVTSITDNGTWLELTAKKTPADRR